MGHGTKIGQVLTGAHSYRITSHEIRDAFMDVYVVTRVDNQALHFEAQAFQQELPPDHEALSQSRRRRMKRIFRSKNFEDTVEKDGRRYLISRVERSSKEWENLREAGVARQRECVSGWGEEEEEEKEEGEEM